MFLWNRICFGFQKHRNKHLIVILHYIILILDWNTQTISAGDLTHWIFPTTGCSLVKKAMYSLLKKKLISAHEMHSKTWPEYLKNADSARAPQPKVTAYHAGFFQQKFFYYFQVLNKPFNLNCTLIWSDFCVIHFSISFTSLHSEIMRRTFTFPTDSSFSRPLSF